MAKTSSFDVTTGADLQEVDNAVNQALKEVRQRYDFRGTNCTIAFDRGKAELRLEADDEYRMKALFDLLQERMIRRRLPIKNLRVGDVEPAAGGRVRRSIGITQGIATDTAREIVKAVKGGGFKKIQVAIQGEQLRVTGPSKDELQRVMAFLDEGDWGVELMFGNYR